jgi:hypothetical protein
MMKRLLLPCLLALSLGAHAMSIRQLHALEASDKNHGKDYATYYLVGVMEGLREAAEAEQRAGQPPLFCVNDRRFGPDMARPVFEGEMARNRGLYEADMPVQLVMSAALQNAYACR